MPHQYLHIIRVGNLSMTFGNIGGSPIDSKHGLMTELLVGRNRIGDFFRLGLLWIFLACGLPAGLAGAQPVLPFGAKPAEQHILLLYAYGYGGRGVELFSDGFFKAITAEGFTVADVYAEYLDLQRQPGNPEYRAQLLGLLRQKYADRRIDLVVTIQQPALELLLKEGTEIAPGAPVIAIQPPPSITEAGGRRIVGELSRFDIKGTLERALEVFPHTRRVVFVSGSSSADSKVAEEAARVAASWQGKLEFEYTTGLSLEDILYRVAHLPPHTIIVFTQYNVDTKGRVALAYEVEGKIAEVANAPVFGFYDYNLRNGGIGGSVIPVEKLGESAGRLAVDILNGTFEPTAPVTLRESKAVPMFDWKQIRRWGGNAARLPEDTVFLNRLPSMWEQYRGFIVGALAFILAESFLIVALLVNIRRRGVAEAARTESEARFHAIFDGIPDAVIFGDTGRRIRLLNPAFTRLFGYSADEAIGRTTEFLYADPADYAEQGSLRFSKEASGHRGSYEMRYRRRDGTDFWAESLGMRILSPDGTVLGLMGMHRDVTERRRIEGSLRESEEKYRALVETTGTGYVIIDLEGRVLDANMEYVRLTGHGALEEISGRNVTEWTAPHDLARNAEEIQKCIRQGGVHSIEIDYIDGVGKCTSIEINATVLIASEGVKILKLCRDVTERKQAREALRKSEATARTLLNLPNAAAILIDREGICLDANETMAVRFAMKSSDIIGTSIWDLLPPEVSRLRKERLQQVLRTKKQVHFEDEREGIWNYSIMSPILDDDGEVSKVAVFGFDITDRKRTEVELKQRQADLLEIQHIGKIASLNWDLRNDIIQWTPELFCIVERDPRSFPHTGEGYLSLVHPEDRQLIEKTLEDSLLGETAPYMEYRFVMPDGRNKYVGSQGKFIRDGKGHPTCMIGYIQDVTERREAEEEKRKLEEQLRQAQKMESVGRLAGGVAHDFNNMLGVILGHTDIALEEVERTQPIYKDLQEIHKAAQRSANLTRQLLAFARKQTVSPKILDLNETLESMLRMLHRLIGEDIELSWKPGLNLWPVKVDPAQVDQVLANLAVNARDAIAGVGIVTIETGNVVIDEAYGRGHAGTVPGEYVFLTVTDTGVGMDKETIEHLFEPFFTTKEVGKGTGLGLATVYGVIKQNHGFVNVYSEPGRGSSFKIYLPRAHTAAALEPAAPERRPSRGVETVLLVEDEEAMLNLGAAILKRHGYTVLTAQAPAEALTLMERHDGPIHLVITDVVMPEMNGRVLMEKLQALRPTVKALYMSGYTANAIAHHGVLEAGVQFLEKPFSLAALTEKVRVVLDQRST